MKIDFDFKEDNKYHQFCPACHSENINRIFKDEKTFYKCGNCQGVFPRMIVIDPQIVWWIEKETKEYWHESVGVFLFDETGKVLFFERLIYPFALAIPAGHLDTNELPGDAIKRELFEETGVKVDDIKLFTEEDIVGDECRRGADNHRWHLYVAKIKRPDAVKINDEGTKSLWLSLNEVLEKDLVYPVRFFINKYGDSLCP